MDRDLEYQQLACETLGLVHAADRSAYPGQLLELGHFRIIESPIATKIVVERYLLKLRTFAQEFLNAKTTKRAELSTGISYRTEPERLHTLEQVHRDVLNKIEEKAVLLPGDFYQYCGRGDTEEKRETWRQGRSFVRDVARKELSRLQRFTHFSADFAGYCEYLDRACPDLFFRLSRDVPALVKEENHIEHAYIMSTTGTGKSELLKALCLNYVQRPDYASLLVIDPGGDMSQQIAQWPELIPQGRLIYIDPAMSDTHVPVINPFDVKGLSPREKGNLTGQIVAVLGSLIENKRGGDLSTAMEAALYPTVRLLIDLPNTSIKDIPEVMRGNERLIEMGRNSSIEQVSRFFQKDFKDVNALTKRSIINKVESILGKGMLNAILCGRNSIDLRAALNGRKVVVANLAKGALDSEESSILGMLLMAMAQSIGMERVHTPERLRPQTHIIVDECQNFVTSKLKDIIRETRKFGMSVTLAQQELGGDMPRDLRDTVVKTTNVKIAGRSALDETEKTGKLVGVSPYEISRCEVGQFYYQSSNKPAFKLRVRGDRLKTKGCVDWATWDKLKAQQMRLFYRPIPKDRFKVEPQGTASQPQSSKAPSKTGKQPEKAPPTVQPAGPKLRFE